MSMYSVSVIIPTLQEAARIGALIERLRQANPAPFEIIVADAQSADGTAQRARDLGAELVLCNRSCRAVQMNAGARLAKGRALYFVHADTLPPPDYLQRIQAAFEAGVAMGCFRYRFDRDHWLLRLNAWFTRFRFLWCQGGDKSFFILREIFEELGGYDESCVVMEEYYFLKKAMKRYRLHIEPAYMTVSARKYSTNSWLRVQTANMGAFAMFRLGFPPDRIKRFYTGFLNKYDS